MKDKYFAVASLIFFLVTFILIDIWGIRNKKKRVRYMTGIMNVWLVLIFLVAMTTWHFYTNKPTVIFIVPILFISTFIIKCGFILNLKGRVIDRQYIYRK